MSRDLHPALRAFGQLYGQSAETTAPKTLSNEAKGPVFTFRWAEADIVAKCCRDEVATVEARAYCRILPLLDLPSLRFYGLVPDSNGTWLFLEASGGIAYQSGQAEHKRAAAAWVGTMHVRAAAMPFADQIPSCGPGAYLRQLQAAMAAMNSHMDHPYLSARDCAALGDAIGRLRRVESRWHAITALCGAMPMTFVHGDLQAKNLHIRATSSETRVLALDWEHSGWGAPAVDLAYLDLDAYAEVVLPHWRNVDRHDLSRLQLVGRLLQSVAAIEWATCSLPYEDAMIDITWYGDRILGELGAVVGC